MSSLPGFASQFGSNHGLSVPHNFMMSYRAIRPSDSELLSNFTSAYGHVNGSFCPLEYYNSIKSLQQSSPPSLPFPVKPTALSALSIPHGQGPTTLKIPRSHTSDREKMTSDKVKTKPVIGHSVDALLKSTNKHEATSLRTCESEKVLDSMIGTVTVA